MRYLVLVALVLAVASSASAATIVVDGLGDAGWLSDDTRSGAGADLVGVSSTHYGKPGQTPTAADDTAIGQQIQFVTGPAGSTYGGAVKIIAPVGNPGKSTVSVINTATGIADAGKVVDGTFTATYQWYMEPNTTVRTLAFRLGIRSTMWAQSQAGFTATRSGESAWDLILTHVMDTPVANAWNTPTVDLNTGKWYLYDQAGNGNWAALVGSAPPKGTLQQTLAQWQADPTWGPVLFGAGAKVTNIQLGLGSGQQNCNAYVDYLQTSLLNGGDPINFTVAIYVDGVSGSDLTGDGSQGNPYATIQKGIDMAPNNATVNVLPATYDGTINLDGRSGVKVVGADKDTTLVKSSTVLPWNAAGVTTGRQTVVRIVNSTDIEISNLTVDCDLIKGNYRYAVTGVDSSVTVDSCVIKNMSVIGQYYELGCYFRAQGFTDAARAAVTVSNSTFIDAGRVALVTHDYIEATITDNEFVMNLDDFGYGIELGSQSTGVIRGNTFHGFDTPAASDNSASAAIYVENCFTAGVTPMTKTVLVEFNEIYGCQYGIMVGNAWTGYAGDVDIELTLNGNNIHDNLEGGAVVVDEGKDVGSSVSMTCTGNSWDRNGEVGLFAYTYGNGDIALDLSGDIICGHEIGVYVGDYAETLPSTSSYSVSLSQCAIAGNSVAGVLNAIDGLTVDAEDNWWGKASGPSVLVVNSGTLRSGDGDLIYGAVDASPFLSAKPSQSNVVYMLVTDASVYVKPTDTVVVNMNVANLAQKVTGLQAMLNFSSTYFLSGSSDVAVTAGGGDWDTLIYDVWTAGGDLDVAVGVDAYLSGGTQADATTAFVTLKPTGAEGVTQVAFRADLVSDPGLIGSTFLSDESSNPVWPAKVGSANIYVDGTAPVVAATTAMQGTQDVKNGASTVIQGAVDITVTVSDALSGLVGAPTVALANGANTDNLTTTGENPAGTFNYVWAVTPSTANGTWTATVTATDKAGNVVTSVFTLVLNKNQVSGQVELEGFVGSSREVTFVATGGASSKTWTLTLTGWAANKAGYLLTEVPSGTTAISAKAAWNLREKLAVTLVDGQATADFVGDGTSGWSNASDHYLRGGDLNGTNSINVLDYSVLKGKWYTTDPVADITGNGTAALEDYSLMRSNWFQVGDAE